MCTVSMIMDHYQDRWSDRRGLTLQEPQWVSSVPQITQEEVEEFHRLLDRARKYDKERGEPDCELEEKRQKLLKLAGELGVEISFL